jgi:hypothetical protein
MVGDRGRLGDVEGIVQSLWLIASAAAMAAEFGGRGLSLAAASGEVAAKPFRALFGTRVFVEISEDNLY